MQKMNFRTNTFQPFLTSKGTVYLKTSFNTDVEVDGNKHVISLWDTAGQEVRLTKY
jgi:hypothetical protein